MRRLVPVLALAATVAASIVGAVPAQAAPPQVTAITSSEPTIYPHIGTTNRPAATALTVTSSADDVTSLEIRDLSDDVVRTFDLSTTDAVMWNGRDTGGDVVPAGSYTLIAFNGEDAAAVTGTVDVSRQRLVRKTYTVKVSPTRAYWKLAGRCSTLRKPARRGWAGSYGYYANTRCGSQTWRASSVITVHAVRVPRAERYVTARVDTYGGAATARRSSRGGIEYWSESAQGWTSFRYAAARVGWHNGRTVRATPMVDAERFVAWRFATAYGAQYDVAKFRITVSYDVLSAG